MNKELDILEVLQKHNKLTWFALVVSIALLYAVEYNLF